MKYDEKTLNKIIKTVKKASKDGKERIYLSNGILKKLGYSVDGEGKTTVSTLDLYELVKDIQYKIEFYKDYNER